jgi:hypothetical protein
MKLNRKATIEKLVDEIVVGDAAGKLLTNALMYVYGRQGFTEMTDAGLREACECLQVEPVEAP